MFSSLKPRQDVTLAALYVSTKMHDTLKKPRDLLMVSYVVRFPEQAAKSKSVTGEIDIDPAVRARSPFQRAEDTTYILFRRWSMTVRGCWP